MTLQDKVDDLTKLVSGLVEQAKAFEGQLDGIGSEKADLMKEVGALGRSLAVVEQQLKDLRGWKDGFGSIDQLKINQALIQKELDEFKEWQDDTKKQKDELGKRLWGLISSIIVALVGWALGYFSRPR